MSTQERRPQHGQRRTGSHTPVPMGAPVPMLLGQKHPAPRVLGSPPGMGSRSPPLRVGILYSSWLWSPRRPPSNHRTPFLLFFTEGRLHSQPPPSSWDTPLGAVTPQGAFLPPFRGAPCLSLPALPWPRSSPTHCRWRMDKQGIWRPLPERQALWPVLCACRASEVLPSSKSCLAHTGPAQGRGSARG